MFPPMRRARQALPPEECGDILRRGSCGVLALAGQDDYPYALPISYVWDGGDRLYFHCARTGHKLDAIARNPRASFCVVGQDIVAPLEYTTHYRSVIAFGRMTLVEGAEEARCALEQLGLKYAPMDSAQNRAAYIEQDWDGVQVLSLTIEHLTGKECIELTRQRDQH